MSKVELTPYVLRPGQGKDGTPTKVKTNFFVVNRLPQADIIHYDVSVTPDVPPPVNRRIYETFMNNHRVSDLGGAHPVYDGRKNMFTARPLPWDSRTFDVTLTEDENPRSKRPIPSFRIKIRKVATINLEELHQFLAGKMAMSNNVLTAIMALDILVRHKPALLYSSVGRSIFTPTGCKPLSGGLNVWQGYYQSVRPGVGSMLLNVNASATPYYQDGSLIEVIIKIMGFRDVEDLTQKLATPAIFTRIEKAIKNLRIVATHRAQMKKSFKIFGLSKTSAKDTEFEHKVFRQGGGPEDFDLVKTKVADYFRQQYSKPLQYPNLPSAIVGKTAQLPLEMCSVVNGQRYIRKLNEKQTADMIKFTCQPPNMRADIIQQGLKLFDFAQNEYLKEFGMEISPEMAQIQARVLKTPTISYHPSSRGANIQPRDGAWNLRDKKVAQGATLGSWGVLVFGTDRHLPQTVVQAFVRELVQTCLDTGMQILNRSPPILYGNPMSNVEGTLKNVYFAAGNAVKSSPQMLLIILPNTGTPLYAEIKRISDTVMGIPTQCMQSKHVARPNKQYCANLCLKINVKLGGMNSFISAQQLPFLDEPTLLVGADVSHPPPGDSNRPSIAAVVGSIDAKAARYTAALRVQTARTETVADMASMMMEMLKTFYQTCGQKPRKILVYRDGVSEGQFDEVMKTEVMAIRAACASLEATYSPKITFVVVQKRHHARFFPVRREDGDKSGNVHPGTTIDSTIVHPFEHDFYQQSHAGLIGTSRPAHYHVLLDENKFTADGIQDFSFKMCHLYARCTRSVSFVPPAYYAHLVAQRGRFHSKGENWSDTESSASSSVGEGSYSALNPSLAKSMWFM